MQKTRNITILYPDIGGVLLTNGWSHESWNPTAEKFHLCITEIEARHHLKFETYDLDKLTVEEYLNHTVFINKDSKDEFREFMFSQSKAFPKMIELMSGLKKQFGLKIAGLSNEACELNRLKITDDSNYEIN